MTMLWNGLELPESYFHNDTVCIIHGDCREALSGVKKCSSAIVTDPPYELGFMGKLWDSKGVSFQKDTWEIIRSTCLSGAPLLSFGGSRTQHRIACAIEDAGWEIRDTLMWVYGSGFPKSLDIGKAIDKAKGVYAKGAVLSSSRTTGASITGIATTFREKTATNPQSPEAQLWDGWNTALKPAYEPIILAMNPVDKTFANNALKYGVAGLNIDECRVPTNGESPSGSAKQVFASNQYTEAKVYGDNKFTPPAGRFPANFLHDGSEEVLELLPYSKSTSDVSVHAGKKGTSAFTGSKQVERLQRGDSGSASRFFYCAKASKSERGGANRHPTVKPLALMEYLCKLVKMPEYNLIIDPFMGSGTTLLACAKLGIPCIGIDSDEQSCETATIRYLRSLNV